jgi:hypothetical protein
MVYYFAYGSNMDKDQMKDRCPDSKEVGIGIIPNYRIDFTRKSISRNCGVADIVKSEDGPVWGVIYEVSEEDFKKLDKHEGYPNCYTKNIIKCYQFVDPNPWGFISELSVQDYYEDLYENPFNFKEIDVIVYEVKNKSLTTIQPSIEYLHLLQSAAEENNFPMKYQEKLNEFGSELRKKMNSQALDLFLEISDEISKSNFAQNIASTQEFGGADLVITGSVERKKQLNENYPLDLVVLTPFWKELSWVVTNIFFSESTKWLFNSYNKYIYFKEFGEAAIEYQSKNPDDKDHVGICRAGITRAYSLLTEGGILFVD